VVFRRALPKLCFVGKTRRSPLSCVPMWLSWHALTQLQT